MLCRTKFVYVTRTTYKFWTFRAKYLGKSIYKFAIDYVLRLRICEQREWYIGTKIKKKHLRIWAFLEQSLQSMARSDRIDEVLADLQVLKFYQSITVTYRS